MRLILCAATAALLGVPGQADACMADPMPQAVLFDRAPAQRPPEHALFRVIGREIDGRLMVRFLEAADVRRLGPIAWLEAIPADSCTTWGRQNTEAYVVARVTGRWRGRPLLTARVYARNRWDSFWGWFGSEVYTASGRPLQNSH